MKCDVRMSHFLFDTNSAVKVTCRMTINSSKTGSFHYNSKLLYLFNFHLKRNPHICPSKQLELKLV